MRAIKTFPIYRQASVRKIRYVNSDVMLRGKLWTAPEILRENFPPSLGTAAGDVYSFSIICYEVLMRTEPYNFDTYSPRGKLVCPDVAYQNGKDDKRVAS